MEQKNLKTQCYEKIKEKIISGDVLPGARLGVSLLAAELGTGPTPIREALSRLTATGLVVAVDNRGFRVAPISENEMRDLYTTYSQIDVMATLQAIDKGDEAWEAGIVASIHRLSAFESKNTLTLANYPMWKERNSAFHNALISGCGSTCLIDIHKDLASRFERYLRLTLRTTFEPMVLDPSEHVILAETVLKRDRGKTVQLLSNHLAIGLNTILAKLQHLL